MILLWTKGNTFLSKAIRAITGQDCSHFSFVFQSKNRNGLMFESNLLGTHPAFLHTFLKSHEIVHSIEVSLSIEEEDKIWDIIIDKYDGKPYDFMGALYLGYRCLLKRYFNRPMPLKNRLAKNDSYFCNEVYDVLNHIEGFPKIDVISGMDTPHDVFDKLISMKT